MTVEQLKKRHPGTDFVLCLGQDSVAQLPTWHRAADLVDLVNIVAVRRSGAPSVVPDVEGKTPRVDYIDVPEYDASATEIRRLIRQGGDVEPMLMPDVAAYIRAHRLYRL